MRYTSKLTFICSASYKATPLATMMRCIQGLRITVDEVLKYLASEMTEAEILDDFPDLTSADIKACIAYAAVIRGDNQKR